MAESSADMVGSFLESLAKKRRTITYGELVAKQGLPELDGAWKSHPLAAIFEYLDQQDANLNRPFRTSVVIKKPQPAALSSTPMPGDGYFESMERLKPGVSGPIPVKRRLQVWSSELASVFAYPWP